MNAKTTTVDTTSRTREILLPKLGDEKGLKVSQDFFLAFSPERVDPGRKDWTTLNTPKVVGGITAGLQRGRQRVVFTGIAKGCFGFLR